MADEVKETGEQNEQQDPTQAEEQEQQQGQPQGEEAQEIEYGITVEDSGPCKKKIAVEVPQDAIKKQLDEQYVELKREAMVPGFRRGRAPLRLLEKRFGDDVRKQVKLKLLADASEKAVEKNEIDVLGDPDIDYENIDMPDEGPMKFEFEVEVRPEFELPALEGIDVEKPKIEVSDAQVDTQIEQMRKNAGVWTPKEGGVESGDQVIADIILKMEPSAEGEESEDTHEKRDNVEVFARERGFAGGVPVDGLDKLLEGAKGGDVKTTTVNVPETFFNERYRGKKVEVEIHIKDVKQLELAEMDKEFFERLGVEDEAELRDLLRQSYERQAEQQARQAMADQVHQHLLQNTQFDLPASIVADQSLQILQRQYTNMLLRGTPKEQIDQQMEDLRASSDQQATEQLKLFFIMDKIADKLDVEVTPEEINGHVAQVAAQRGQRPEKMREQLARDGSLTQFAMQVREHKCVEQILEKANIREVEGQGTESENKAAGKAVKKPKEAAPAEAETAEEEGDEKKAATRQETAAKRTKKSTKSEE